MLVFIKGWYKILVIEIWYYYGLCYIMVKLRVKKINWNFINFVIILIIKILIDYFLMVLFLLVKINIVNILVYNFVDVFCYEYLYMYLFFKN